MTIVQLKIIIRLMKKQVLLPKIESNVLFAVGALAVLSVLVMSLMYTCCEPCWITKITHN